MAREPTDAELKGFWEECDVKPVKHYEQVYLQRGDYYLEWPALTLDNLFKWAVPKVLKRLEKQGYATPIMALFSKWYDYIVTLTGDSRKVEVADIALFRVCQEVLHDK